MFRKQQLAAKITWFLIRRTHVIINRSITRHIEVYYHFDLIKADKDDNKFVDCAIKATAKYIVSNDHHLDILKQIPFPKVEVIDINKFIEELNKY